MANYTMVDLRMDYKKDTGNNTSQGYRSDKEYVNYLEEELIKLRDMDLKFQEFISRMNESNHSIEINFNEETISINKNE